MGVWSGVEVSTVKNSNSMKCVRQNTVLQVIAHRGTERCASTSAPIVDLVKNSAISMSPSNNRMKILNLLPK